MKSPLPDIDPVESFRLEVRAWLRTNFTKTVEAEVR